MARHLYLDIPVNAAIVIEDTDGRKYLSVIIDDAVALEFVDKIVATEEKDIPEKLKNAGVLMHKYLGVEYGGETDFEKSIKPAPIDEVLLEGE